ncbi:hypothetical protein QPB21_004629 [Vibrio alginolyticus]|nr:hypothetical protein [Vibrio alginolyticus]
MHEKIKKISDYIFKQNFIVRNIIIAVIGSLGGASYLGKLSEAASYLYAWNSGFRVPAEGVPYLALTVFGLSFSLMLLAILIFVAAYLFGLAMHHYSENNLLMKVATKIFRFGIKDINTLTIVASALAASSLVSIGFLVAPYFDPSIKIATYISVPLSFIGTFITYIVLWRKGALKVAAAFISIVFVFGAPWAMFSTTAYGSFLNSVGYGGGITVEISGSTDYSGVKLLLRTSQSLILQDTTNNNVIEVPLNKVNEIMYPN